MIHARGLLHVRVTAHGVFSKLAGRTCVLRTIQKRTAELCEATEHERKMGDLIVSLVAHTAHQPLYCRQLRTTIAALHSARRQNKSKQLFAESTEENKRHMQAV